MSAHVVGVDLSLSSTGLSDGTSVQTVRSRPDSSVYGTVRRLDGIAHQVLQFAHGADLVVVEGPSYGSQGAGTWDRAGLWWHVVDCLYLAHHTLAVIPPSSLKRFATGKGNAGKGAMIEHLTRRRPSVNHLGDDNAVDAAWLAIAGHEILGQPLVSLPAAQVEALAKVVPETAGQ